MKTECLEVRKWGTKHFHCHSFDHLGFTRFQRNLWFWWKWLIHISFILALELKVCVSYSYGYSVSQDVGAILGNLFGKTLKMFLKCDKLVEKKTSWSLQTTQEPAIWCSRNNLELQMLKTVEMTVDRWSPPPLQHLNPRTLNSMVMCLLWKSSGFWKSTISQDLKWASSIDTNLLKYNIWHFLNTVCVKGVLQWFHVWRP